MTDQLRTTVATPKGDAFGIGEQPNPHAFIQWKGTDVCMDFYCECGAHCHFDGFFAYAVKCPHCAAEWEMPFMLFPRRLKRRYEPVRLQPDKDKDVIDV